MTFHLSKRIVSFWAAVPVIALAADSSPSVDLSKDKVLYEVGYAHLDTQWRWCYPQVIREFIPGTVHQNVALLEKYPNYIFNFSGANRYRMLKEYQPADFELVRQWVGKGRWFPCGNSWEESDVNIPSSESLIRQVMFGHNYFMKEFGVESAEYMLPDCFGFPASLPSVLSHCGVRGFSTQKLTWHSAVGIPFNVGIWEGLDGQSVIAALNSGDYNGTVGEDLTVSSKWKERLDSNGAKSGLFADYQYFGVGDRGGSPTEESVKWVNAGSTKQGPVKVVSAKADQMFRDISDAQKARLPKYKGDLLLIEHSAGSLTSQGYMKRWNRKNELLADAAERASVAAYLLGAECYPREKLHHAWELLLGGQFHDILPGTSVPKAYNYSWNDEIIAMNSFAEVLQDAVGAVVRGMDTRVQGTPLVVYNPLSIDRDDVVEAELEFASIPVGIRVTDAAGKPVPAQLLSVQGKKARFLFEAKVPSVGFAVYAAEPLAGALASSLHVSERSLENAHYRITLNDAGDIASIFDKSANRELLSAPARLAFLHENPAEYPAWNMDWHDRTNPPIGYVDGPATFRVAENGPLRIALEVTREAKNSKFVQTIRLTAGSAGDRVEIANRIDWHSSECCLKAEFPLTVSNPKATYNWEIGKIERTNNDPKKYEVPTHQWLDLTDKDGAAGVTLLTDAKYGSDKPSDNVLRLTLLYTPGVKGGCNEQQWQDWGHHEFVYGLTGHKGGWQSAKSDWQAARMEQPLMAFRAPVHKGKLGHSFSLLRLGSDQVAVRAIKMAEEGDDIIVRLQELEGSAASKVSLKPLAAIVSAAEVNGVEKYLKPVRSQLSSMELLFNPYQLRSLALSLKPFGDLKTPRSQCVALPFNLDAFSSNTNRKDGAFDTDGSTIPAEMISGTVISEGIAFKIGPTADGRANAVACQGQRIALPSGSFNRVYLLAAAVGGDVDADFAIDAKTTRLNIQDWTQSVGQWESRVFKGRMTESSYYFSNPLDHIIPGYIKRAPLACYCSHRHLATGKDAPYSYSYLFKYRLDLPAGAKSLTLPENPKVRVFAVTVAQNENDSTSATLPLYDVLPDKAPAPTVETPNFEYAPKGLQPIGKTESERVESYDQSTLARISNTDYADANSGNGVTVEYAQGPGLVAPARNDSIQRLNDGRAATTNDDTQANCWFDGGEARILMDLKKPTHVARVNTFSWHRADRAPQAFTLWASDAESRPTVAGAPDKAGWKLLSIVDTSELGEGGIHVTSVLPKSGDNLGTWRHLMWVQESVQQGTFFTELDVLETK